jgi:hypothetical protein
MNGVADMLADATQPLAVVISRYVRQLGGAPRSPQPTDVKRVIGMVGVLETLPEPRQLMGTLGYKLLL